MPKIPTKRKTPTANRADLQQHLSVAAHNRLGGMMAAGVASTGGAVFAG